jgi:capsid protein
MSRLPQNVFEQNERFRADYDMAKASRLRRRRNVPAGGSHADYHYRSEADFLKCMEYSRDVARNDVVCSAMMETVNQNTIQDGFTLDFQTGVKSLDQDLLGLWNEWAYDADNCDLAQEHTFADMEGMSFDASLIDGDIWGMGTDEGQLQWWEAHRARTPTRSQKTIIHGVKLNENRKREQVWITKEDLEFSMRPTLVRDFQPYDIRDEDGLRRVFQVYTRTVKRYSQTRGVTAFAPMFDLFGMHDDTQFNAAVKQQVLNAILIFRKRDKDYQTDGPAAGLGTQSSQTQDLQDELVERIGPATVVKGKVGEDFQAFNSTAPGNEFFPHVKLILTLLGINLGLPLILVLKDASETNFSGWRGAFEQAKMGFRRNQNKLVRRMHDPVLAWKIAQFCQKDPALARAVERVVKRHREIRHTWHTPTWPYVQPLDDRNADLIAVANYQDSPSGIMAKSGLDYSNVIAKCVSDRGAAIRLAKDEAAAINAQYPDDDVKVTWRDIYVPPTPANLSGLLQPTERNPQKGGSDATA